jgi:hypothetical protein
VTLIELLDELGRLDVHIWADGDRLRLRAAVGALTPALRAALESHKPALLVQLRASNEHELPPIARVPRSGPMPLSFAQQRLWFLAELEPESAAYNIPAAVRISGALDPLLVERAANEIVRRQEVLRTTFRNERGGGVAEIHDALPIRVGVTDLSALDPAAQPNEIRRLASEQTRALFDLTRGPLLRVSLLRLARDEHVLLFTIHHLASDGWSSRVFMRELAALYEAFVQGRRSPLPELPVQYVDFAAWQRDWLRGDRLERQLTYWKSRLDRLPVLDLPTDRPRPPVQTFDGASIQFALPRELGDRLKQLARQEGATLFQLLLAAFATLLHHVSGAEDLPIGSPVVNRGRRELESLIGLFVNTMILRVDLSGRPSFRQLIHRVRDVSIDASAHQDLPFEQLVAELRPERDLSRHALFQIVFVHQDNPVERQEIQGLTLRQIDIDSWHVKFDLVVNTWESQDGLVVWWEYNSALFDRSTIETLFERYARVLAAVVDAPDARVDEIEILDPAELAILSADAALPALAREFEFTAS